MTDREMDGGEPPVPTPPSRPPRRLIDIATLATLGWNLAVALPLLDITGRNVEFFTARGSPRSDLVALALVLALGVPLVLTAIVAMISRFAPRLGAVIEIAVVGAALTAVFLQGLLKTGAATWPALVLVVLCVLVAIAVAVALQRVAAARDVARIGLLVPFVAIGLFAFASPAQELLFPDNATTSDVAVARPAPVVVAVFDELPLATLLDSERGIDRELFPNFARLAEDATWYRNTTTVANFSGQAVPAILDGNYPRPDAPPVTSYHRNNLLALLDPDYDLFATEFVTRFCSPPACVRANRKLPTGERWTTLASDGAIVWLHMTLPPSLRTSLPPVTMTWAEFAERQRLAGQRTAADGVRGLIGTIRPRGEPTFYFLHSFLPHNPWHHLPTGQTYPHVRPAPGMVSEGPRTKRWDHDEWLVAVNYQRHVFQVQFADRLLGELLDRLASEGIYDDTLLVVTSDHGVSFVPESQRRGVTGRARGGVAWVPLFIKSPGQDRSAVVDDPMETIDIPPTVLSLLRADGAPTVNGSAAPGTGGERRIFDVSEGSEEDGKWNPPPGTRGVELPATQDELWATLRHKFAMLGRAGTSVDPARIAPDGLGDLVGLDPSRLRGGVPAGTFALVDAELYENVDLDGAELPALVRGSVVLDAGVTSHVPLALVVNGRIAAVTRTFDESGTSAQFNAMVLPSYFADGQNVVEVHVVDTTGPERVLRPLTG